MGIPKLDSLRKYSSEEYFSMLEYSEERLEFFAGEVRAMSGGSRNHAVLSANMVGLLQGILADRDCTVFGSELKVYSEKADSYMFPDCMVACKEELFPKGKNDVLLNPMLIVEVLSPSTVNNDFIEKFDRYIQIPTLLEYVLVSQDRYRVEVRSAKDNWGHVNIYSGPEHLVVLDSINGKLPVENLYRRVVFNQP